MSVLSCQHGCSALIGASVGLADVYDNGSLQAPATWVIPCTVSVNSQGASRLCSVLSFQCNYCLFFFSFQFSFLPSTPLVPLSLLNKCFARDVADACRWCSSGPVPVRFCLGLIRLVWRPRSHCSGLHGGGSAAWLHPAWNPACWSSRKQDVSWCSWLPGTCCCCLGTGDSGSRAFPGSSSSSPPAKFLRETALPF